jgi:hypothetical protein
MRQQNLAAICTRERTAWRERLAWQGDDIVFADPGCRRTAAAPGGIRFGAFSLPAAALVTSASGIRIHACRSGTPHDNDLKINGADAERISWYSTALDPSRSK